MPGGGHSEQVLPEAVTGGRGVGTVVPELSAEPGLCQGLFTWMEGPYVRSCPFVNLSTTDPLVGFHYNIYVMCREVRRIVVVGQCLGGLQSWSCRLRVVRVMGVRRTVFQV